MAVTDSTTAAGRYAARVEAVLAQRTRLRGPQPPGDLFAGLPASHPLLRSDPRRRLEPNLEVIASYVEPEDVIVDAGGGAGRYSLPLALRCREAIAVDPSAAMGAGFTANATQAGIANARFVQATWPAADPLAGSVALVNHVTYLTREIVPFVEALERAGRRRVLITVNAPPPPSRHRALFALLYGEPEEIVPGHVELVDALWEMGILPDVRVLPASGATPFPPAPTREKAIEAGATSFGGEQWALWPLEPDLRQRLQSTIEAHFDQLFAETDSGFVQRWIAPAREILITWRPGHDRLER